MLFFNPYLFSKITYNGYITSNLVGYWDYGLQSSYYGANALVLHDLSGNGLDMTYSLGDGYYPPPYTSNGYSATVQVGGPAGASSTQNGYLANVAYVQNFSSTGFTFENAYAIPGLIAQGYSILSLTNGCVYPTNAIYLGYNTSGGWGWWITIISNGVGYATPALLNTSAFANQFYHALCTMTGSGAYNIYINGTLIGYGTTGFNLPPSSFAPSFLAIGSYNTGNRTGQAGIVNMARVYNAPLSASNVWTNYGNVYQNLTYKTYTPTVPSYKTYVTSNLVGYWDFTNSASYPGSGVAVTDLSGSNIGLTISGTPSYNSTGALSYNPSSSSYAASSAVALNLSSGFTLETLVYFTSLSNSPVTFAYATVNNTTYIFQYVSTAGGLYGSSSNGGYFSSGNGTIVTGQWYHLVSVFASLTASSCVHYINGVAQTISGNVNFSSFPNNPASTQIYLGSGYNNFYLNGKFALGRIYNTALTAAQVQENYVSAFSKLTGTVPYVMTGLLGYWDLADSRSSSLAGSALNDLGPVGTNLSISGTPSYNSTGALSYNPSSSSYAASSAVALNFTSGLTVECLVYFTSLSTTPNTLSYGSSISSYFQQEIQTNGALYFSILGFSSYTGQMYTAASTITTGQWYHIVSVVPSPTSAYTACSHYVNGISIPITGGINWTGLPNNPASTQIYLGNNSWVSGQYVNGKVAMGRIYGIPLSASQVLQNYSAAFSKLASNPYVLPPPLNLDLAFPPIPLTSSPMSMSAQSYGNGQYITNASSAQGSFPGYLITGSWWNTPTGVYNTSSPYNCTSGKSLGGVSGEWVTIQLPVPLLLNSYSFGSLAANAPQIWSLLGSNDGTNWTVLDNARNYTTPWNGFTSTVLFIPSATVTTAYTIFGIVITNLQGNSGQLNIGYLKFFGTPVSSLAVPLGLPYWTSNQYTTTNLIGYWDAALTPSSSGTGSRTLYDLSGLGNNMIFASAPTYTSSPPSYTVGTANSYVTSLTIYQASIEILVNLNGFTGTNSKLISLGPNGVSNVFFQVTSTGSTVTAASITGYGTSGSLYYVTASITTPSVIPATGWFHLIFSYGFDGTYSNPIAISINGQIVQVTQPYNNTAIGTITLGSEWELGHSIPGDSGISGAQIGMCRVYSNVALNANQIMTNYIHTINKLPTNVYSLPYTPTVTTFQFYTVTAFLNSGIFTLASTTPCDILVVGGGSGGGIDAGGGAGGYQFFTGQILSAGNYQVIVGSGGGNGINSGQQVLSLPPIGGNSQFGSLAPSIGGGGCIINTITAYSSNLYVVGGSGCGGGGTYTGGGGTGGGNAGTAGQGYAGGSVGPGGPTGGGGGGGGAGGAGYNPVGNTGGNGGPGVINNGFGTAYGQNVSGNYYFAGGGGGGGSTPAIGGNGGGGNAVYVNANGNNGTPNTGGGGGGSTGGNPGQGGIGGSGIVLVRYLVSPQIFPNISLNGGTGSGTVGSPYTITSSGVTFTVTASSQYGSSIGYPWYAFDKSPTASNNNDWLASGTNTVNTSGTTSTTTTVVSGTTICGEWVQLAFTSPTKTMTQYSLLAPYSAISVSSWVIAGSNDGSTWTLIDQRGQTTNSSGVVTGGSAVILSSTSMTTFTVSTSAFAYFRLITRAGYTVGAGFTGMSEFIIYAN